MDDLHVKHIIDAIEALKQPDGAPWDDEQVDSILAEYRRVEAVKLIANMPEKSDRRTAARRELLKWSGLR